MYAIRSYYGLWRVADHHDGLHPFGGDLPGDAPGRLRLVRGLAARVAAGMPCRRRGQLQAAQLLEASYNFV